MLSPKPEQPFDADLSLRSATVQNLQLELIRRTQRNALDGEQVVRDLLRHRDKWAAVLLDRMYLYDKSSLELPLSGLIKLRDLPHNHWNADTLYILCESREAAQVLMKLAEDEWCGMPRLIDDEGEVSRSLGSWREDNFLVRVWWD
jgi:hypothetical protein